MRPVSVFLNRLKGNSRRPTLVRDWKNSYGRPLPNLVALLARGGGGSHFVLHKLQGHPSIVALEQGVLTRELKQYFTWQLYPIKLIQDRQLNPRKNDLAPVEWIAINKPKIDDVAYHFPFHRDKIRLIKVARNPVAFYYSLKSGWDVVAQRDYGEPGVDKARLLKLVTATLLSDYMDFGFYRDEQLDLVLSTESLATQTQENLDLIFSALHLPSVANDALATLQNCIHCGGPLVAMPRKDGQPVLKCSRCGKEQLGPGGYNYIRKEGSDYMKSWSQMPEADRLVDHFSGLFGRDFMSYYINEEYLLPGSSREFAVRFSKMLKSIRSS